ncbi:MULTISPECIES: sensor histidine kinase [Herbaspirillum]|jgi:two-component system OmpR family sensor kinase|uniref:sensor histidine kinase n=1 Tax=Herbaspirillum TaxID=963 RepID=UPI001064AB8A|nr:MULTISPECIES: HAMP domain-containing sensor histidine kinase [Herbaspirillum]MCP3658006.1 HAMP domain-containing histidine kinase [Herbaspirillum sp.]MCP3946536.1 HAMP domain-containing histidine kinase [Herbaspirillum sp.]MCP4029744.1 HAMP domain-containing histidine kinase [Herbaspirillum sp.]MCP4554006.1 HAMP domain-containing histidine kinase [Herbaspirillum sp.]QBP77761.1 HAMP domain-containing histidine kinase [Herbaspirillum huttiense]
MFRLRLSLAFGLLVVLVCVQAGFVYWGANRVNDYAQHSRLASDIQSELLELSANKQRLRVWASQQLMDADASPEVRDRLLASMQESAARLQQLARRDITLWTEIAARDQVPIPADVEQLASVADLLSDNIAAVQTRLLALAPLRGDAEFSGVWREINQVFDMARGRDLRELLNGAIERQRKAVPIARLATERGLDRVRTQAIFMVIMTLLGAALLALHLGRRLQRPLERLLDGVRALRAGQLDHRVPVGSGDEFDRVAEGFNAMAAELQQHRADADAARRRLEEAVEARTGELRHAHETLQHIDLRRRQLFADLGHELRTPTTAIRGEAEIALRGADKPAQEYRQALQRIVEDSKQLTGRINDLLLIAKAEADQIVMQPQPIQLHELLTDAADVAEALGADNQVSVQRLPFPEADACWLMADAERLRQAIVIVLDNAIRYSPRGAVVSVQCLQQPDRVQILITDQGIGIDADELPQVFERFVRGRRARAHRADGTGIGLSIARAILHAHHGEIRLQSTPGEGTCVTIDLPRHPAPVSGSRDH